MRSHCDYYCISQTYPLDIHLVWLVVQKGGVEVEKSYNSSAAALRELAQCHTAAPPTRIKRSACKVATSTPKVSAELDSRQMVRP